MRVYCCIDLKSFYASVECRERGLDPLKTNLVVADRARTEKTICLAVSPSLKAYGIPGRARLFEVVQKVREINYQRKFKNRNHEFIGTSYDDVELRLNSNLQLDYIVAVPRMAKYMEYSISIYNIYLKYVAPEDIYAYSIDEVFIDITNYLKTANITPRQMVTTMINDVFKTTGITATGGIGTNMYLAKIAMDIGAKHIKADKNGVRIAELNEMTYRKMLWNHRPLTDFWRIGKGYAKKLEENNMFTMGDVARCSINNEELLYKLFGINAELLIDHSWGDEPCTMADVKNFKPSKNSVSSGQVLPCPHEYEEAKLNVKEMAEQLSLELVKRNSITNQIVLDVEYDIENLTNPSISSKYKGEITIDKYGRKSPKKAHGTANLEKKTSSTKVIMREAKDLFERIVNKNLLVRKLNITFNNLVSEDEVYNDIQNEQISLFVDYQKQKQEKTNEIKEREKENKLQHTIIEIKNKYGKNAILKGMNLEEGATTIKRNAQIGGHKE